MNARKQQIEALFAAAVDLTTPEQREIYLARSCGGDPQLRREVEELLRAYEKAGRFLPAESSGPRSEPGLPE